MGYSTSLMINTGVIFTEVIDLGDYTYNVSPMYSEAIKGGLPSINTLQAAEAIPTLEKAVTDMEDNPDKYKALNPVNGWGNYEGALKYLKDMLSACKQHPQTTIFIQ